jgi:hypothetical protein
MDWTESMTAASRGCVVALFGLLLAACTYMDGGMRPDDKVRENHMSAAYRAMVEGRTTQRDAEAALGQPYCIRPLKTGEVELRWGGPSTKINEVHFLGMTTNRYVATGGWAMALVFSDGTLVGKPEIVPGTDGDEPCVVTCRECFYGKLAAKVDGPGRL